MSKQWLVGAGMVAAMAGVHAQLAGPVTMNDTGALTCVKGDGSATTHCAGTGQDGAYGRDALAPADGNGHGGFKFVKLDVHGEALAADAPAWRCVADRVTGLVWEVKTKNGGVDGAGWIYTNRGDATDPGDTGALVAAVNAKHLCGSGKWRLPTINELQSIVDFGVAGAAPVDARYFPDIRPTPYWTSTPYADDPLSTWDFSFDPGNTGDGAGRADLFAMPAMLVHDTARAAVADPASRYTFSAAGDEVTDTWTKLVWKRCSAGQTWNGSTCTGNLATPDWRGALALAAAEAAQTGQAWRLPNQKEASSIVDRTVNYPAIDQAVFPGGPAVAYYWTSTPYANDLTWAFTIDIRGGYTQPLPMTGEALPLRLVRDAS